MKKGLTTLMVALFVFLVSVGIKANPHLIPTTHTGGGLSKGSAVYAAISSNRIGGVVFLTIPTSVEVEPAQKLDWQFSEKGLIVKLVFGEDHHVQLGPWPLELALTALHYVSLDDPFAVTITSDNSFIIPTFMGWAEEIQFNLAIAKSGALSCRLFHLDTATYGSAFFGDTKSRKSVQLVMEHQIMTNVSFLQYINSFHNFLRNCRTHTSKNDAQQCKQYLKYASLALISLGSLASNEGSSNGKFLQSTYPEIYAGLMGCYNQSKTVTWGIPSLEPAFETCLWEKMVKGGNFKYLNSDWEPLKFDPMSVMTEKNYVLEPTLEAFQQSPVLEVVIRLVPTENPSGANAYLLTPTPEKQAQLLEIIRADYNGLIEDVETFIHATRFFFAVRNKYLGSVILPQLAELEVQLEANNTKFQPVSNNFKKYDMPYSWEYRTFDSFCPPLYRFSETEIETLTNVHQKTSPF